jgi:hypothetical protein
MKHWIVPMIRDFSTVDLPLQSTRNMWAIDKVPSCYTDYSVECPRHPYAHSHMAVTSGDSRCTVPRGWNSWDGAWLSRWSVLPIIMANLRHMFLLVSTYRCVYVYVYIYIHRAYMRAYAKKSIYLICLYVYMFLCI